MSDPKSRVYSRVRWNPLPISSAGFPTTKRTFQNWLSFLYIYTCSEIIRYFPTKPGGFGFQPIFQTTDFSAQHIPRLRHQVWTRPFLYGEYHVVPFQVFQCQIGAEMGPSRCWNFTPKKWVKIKGKLVWNNPVILGGIQSKKRLVSGVHHSSLTFRWSQIHRVSYGYPEPWGRFPIWRIFFKWVETTNQYKLKLGAHLVWVVF